MLLPFLLLLADLEIFWNINMGNAGFTIIRTYIPMCVRQLFLYVLHTYMFLLNKIY